jgi:predicted pyridoxine 5'-phosphate oxidase superfamily flavin-nucleotide-binding protein
MTMTKRERAAEAYVTAMRTGETSALEVAKKHIAQDVVLTGATVWGRQGATVEGYDDVVRRITGQWPNTPVYARGYWSAPKVEGDQVKVTSTYPGMGAAPAAVNLTFSFNDQDQIKQIDQEIVPQPRPEVTDTIPDVARGMINAALVNDTPMTVAYVDADGTPNLSLRGSVQVYSPTQLSICLRSTTGGLHTAIGNNPNISLLYRDSKTRSTLVVQGKAHVEMDKEICDRVWDLIQEVEQNHETRESGCALIIDVTKMQGGSPRGGIRMQREA